MKMHKRTHFNPAALPHPYRRGRSHIYKAQEMIFMASTQYNVAVIGAGPGGYVAAIRAAQLGAKVAIVEKQYLGGTCLNVGCIPSKAMLHIAEVMHMVESMGELGIELTQPPRLDMGKAVAFTANVVKRMTGGIGTLMKANQIDVFDGLGSVDVSRTVTVTK